MPSCRGSRRQPALSQTLKEPSFPHNIFTRTAADSCASFLGKSEAVCILSSVLKKVSGEFILRTTPNSPAHPLNVKCSCAAAHAGDFPDNRKAPPRGHSRRPNDPRGAPTPTAGPPSPAARRPQAPAPRSPGFFPPSLETARPKNHFAIQAGVWMAMTAVRNSL